jgi:glycosyltransferase involved in cell wall biosynthesis
MRIAQIAPIVESVPPKKYGGTERVMHALVEELVSRGHKVTLFATGDSLTSAQLVSVFPKSLRELRARDLYHANPYTMTHIGYAYERQNEFDIIHDHNDYFSMPIANISHTPVVMTAHGAFNSETIRVYQKLRNPYLVTISEAQGKGYPSLHYAGTVYNGLKMEDYPFSEEHDSYLLFVGRISMEKGVHYAIEAAKYLNLPLIIAAKLDDADRSYFEQYVKPGLTEDIKWVGEVDEMERNRLMSRAMAFLHPVTWREPFGLTLIEAMACGCPVVAFSRGSIPEIVQDGKTGFVVADIEGMLDAVPNIGKIKRQDCRNFALENFSAKKMADGYEKIYKQILESKI